MKETANTYQRLKNPYTFLHRTVFSTSVDKWDEINQVLFEIHLNKNLSFSQNLTESDLDNIDVRYQLEQQFENQELKDSGWRFDKIIQWQYISVKLLS